MFKRLLHKLYRVIHQGNKSDLSSFKVSEEEAISVAREECMRRNWPWVTPIKVEIKWQDKWVVKTGLRTKGYSRQTYVIDANTGELISAGAQPR